MNDELRIYVACLASYNNGRLHGEWIDVEGKDADELMDEVRERVLLTSPYPNVRVECPECGGDGIYHRPVAWGFFDGGVIRTCPEPCARCKHTGTVPSAEEWAIHDHEGFGSLVGEYTSFATIAGLGEAISEHGEAFIAYAEWAGDTDVDNFEEAYCGEWDSEQAYAENLIDEMGYLDEIPQHLQGYFDYEAFTRDLFLCDYTFEAGHVFREC